MTLSMIWSASVLISAASARAASGWRLLAARQRRARHIVSPAPPALGGMVRAHAVSAIIVELAREEGMVIRLGNPPCPRLASRLHLGRRVAQ